MTRTGHSDLLDIAVTVIHETDLAWLVDSGTGKAWIAKSQAELDDGTLTAPEGLLVDKGLV